MNRLLACTSVIALCAAWSCAIPPIALADAVVSSTDTAASMPTTLEGQIQRAKTLRAEGNLSEAQRSLAQLMLVAPDDARVVGEYGKTLVQQGNGKDAIPFLTRAVQINGGDWTLHSALGVAYDQAGDRNSARKSYDRALAMKPGEASILNNYAMSRMLAGDYDGAVQMFSQLQAGAGDNPKIAANLAKARELKEARDVKLASTVPAKAPDAPVVAQSVSAAIAKSSANNGVVMQKVPADPLAGPVSNTKTAIQTLAANPQPTIHAAIGGPRPLVPAKAPAQIASTHTKLDPATTIMQKVPVDPQAGLIIKPAPEKRVTQQTAARPALKKTIEMAKTTPTKPVPKIAPPPSLRTAAD